MYEALIDFAEESIFSRINRILEEERSTLERCAKVLYLVLGFAEKNPGITRILLGDALVGEHDRLLERTEHLFARLETQLRQILREAHIRLDLANSVPAESFANLLLVWLEGRMHQYVRSHFKQSPLAQWEEQWSQLSSILSKPDQFPAG
jgi:TetR/AcrR family transcriptional regulator